MLTFDHNADDKVITLKFAGHMDTMTTGDANELIRNEPVMARRQGDETIVIDVKEVTYIASAFIRTCVRLAQEAGPGRFSVIHCQPLVRKIFKISGLDEVLNIT